MIAEENWQQRTQLLLGNEKIDLLKNSKVLIAGLGGVGAYAAEMLCRAGIGKMHIIDADVINPSNINRQLLALKSTIGKSKAELMKERLLDINPELELKTSNIFLKEGTIEDVFSEDFDYVVDAIDTLSPKIFFIIETIKKGTPLISSMGSGGKTNPALIQITDFGKTYNDKLARILRKRIHKFGIRSGFKVVFSSEQTNPDSVAFVHDEQNKKTTVGTISYMPAIFGCYMASEVIRDIAEVKDFKL